MAEPLLVSGDRAAELKNEAVHLPSWDLTFRQIWDAELLLSGAFSPLQGFLNKADYGSVLDNTRLANSALWPIPIMLDVTRDVADTLEEGSRVALRHPEGMVLAVMTISDIWRPTRKKRLRKSWAQRILSTQVSLNSTTPIPFTLAVAWRVSNYPRTIHFVICGIHQLNSSKSLNDWDGAR